MLRNILCKGQYENLRWKTNNLRKTNHFLPAPYPGVQTETHGAPNDGRKAAAGSREQPRVKGVGTTKTQCSTHTSCCRVSTRSARRRGPAAAAWQRRCHRQDGALPAGRGERPFSSRSSARVCTHNSNLRLRPCALPGTDVHWKRRNRKAN